MGAISVKSSAFNNNTAGNGLSVNSNNSNGTITLSAVTANKNNVYGALLSNNGSGGTGAISVVSSTFNGNINGDGLDATSNGTITLNKVTASSNHNNGAVLSNNGAGATGAISVISSVFSGNTTGDGLSANSYNAITLYRVIANSNGGYGADLENNGGGTGAISVSFSTFNTNTNNGLKAQSNGAITLIVVQSNGNTGVGASLDNCEFDGTNCTATGNMSVANSIFNGNRAGSGLTAYSQGVITLNKVTANTNLGFGAYLISTTNSGATNISAINISFSNFYGNTSTYGYGLEAGSTGNITLNKVTANNNTGYGAFLRNSYSGRIGVITISSSVFQGNSTGGSSTGNGLGAYSNGAITLNKVTATRNANDGVFAYTSGNIVVGCGSNLSTNGAYGIAATLPTPGTTLTLKKAVVLTGNALGQYLVNGVGTLVNQPICP